MHLVSYALLSVGEALRPFFLAFRLLMLPLTRRSRLEKLVFLLPSLRIAKLVCVYSLEVVEDTNPSLRFGELDRRVLLRLGVDLLTPRTEQPTLHCLVTGGHIRVVKLLLSKHP